MKEYQYKNLKIINADCMDIMKNYSDNYFDLAIIDPPYRDSKDNAPTKDMRKIIGEKNDRMRDFGNKPNQDYFNELFRITKNQIIWGANNFIENLYSTNCFIFWYKGNPMENYSDGEMAWTSFSKVAKCFDYRYYGSLSGNTKAVEKIHPTQKPIQLYNWILKNYGDKDFKILDTHLGSGSSAIASFYFGCKEFVGMEIDKYYYDKSIKRIKQQTAQIKLF